MLKCNSIGRLCWCKSRKLPFHLQRMHRCNDSIEIPAQQKKENRWLIYSAEKQMRCEGISRAARKTENAHKEMEGGSGTVRAGKIFVCLQSVTKWIIWPGMCANQPNWITDSEKEHAMKIEEVRWAAVRRFCWYIIEINGERIENKTTPDRIKSLWA